MSTSPVINIDPHLLAAFKKIVNHRVAVTIAGKRLNLPDEQLFAHDESKLTPYELTWLTEAFEKKEKAAWHDQAWEHHWKNNPHHIEYWEDKNLRFTLSPDAEHGDIKNTFGIGGGTSDPSRQQTKGQDGVWMPDHYVRELVVDWMAACYGYEGHWPTLETWTWGKENVKKMANRLEKGDGSLRYPRQQLYKLLIDLHLLPTTTVFLSSKEKRDQRPPFILVDRETGYSYQRPDLSEDQVHRFYYESRDTMYFLSLDEAINSRDDLPNSQSVDIVSTGGSELVIIEL